MPNIHNTNWNEKIYSKLSELSIHDRDDKLRVQLQLHGYWLDYTEAINFMRHHGRVCWKGVAPQVPLSIENHLS